MPVACVHSVCFHSLCIIEHATSNLLEMTMMEPLFRWSSIAVISNMEIASNADYSTNPFWVGHDWMPPRQRHPQLPSSAQTGTPNFDTFFSHLFMILTCEQMTIKHSIYTWKVPFLCTERACVVFFQYQDSP